jgi:hypothetical protein
MIKLLKDTGIQLNPKYEEVIGREIKERHCYISENYSLEMGIICVR